MARQSTPNTRGDRSIRYREIADDLRDRLRESDPPVGSLLPSEADLSATYGVSRVTVRSALDVLRADGLVQSHQGLGWRVSAAPLRQSLERLGTIEDMIAAVGRKGERRVLDFGSDEPPAHVAEVLGAAPTLMVRRLDTVDGAPFALVTVWCPEELGAGLSPSDVERSALLDQLPVVIEGATQVIGAGAARSDEAGPLGVAEGSPVLRVRRVTRGVDRSAVLVSQHVFPAGLMEFVAELSVRTEPGLEATFRFVGDADAAET